MHKPRRSVLLGGPAIDEDGSLPGNPRPEFIMAEGAGATCADQRLLLPLIA